MKWILRILGFIWASPITLLGLVVALGGRAEVFYNKNLVFYLNPDTYLYNLFNHRQTLALTLGYVIIGIDDVALEDIDVQNHELTHVNQYAFLGIFFIPFYCFNMIINYLLGSSPYWDNVLEKQAYRSAQLKRPLHIWESYES